LASAINQNGIISGQVFGIQVVLVLRVVELQAVNAPCREGSGFPRDDNADRFEIKRMRRVVIFSFTKKRRLFAPLQFA
jgi:hypothetical protein